jgi:general secretion pathway protein B
MSYILDALKKADAERERGSVPGLHSQAQAPVPDEAEATPARLPLAWMVAGAGLCVIGLLSWQLLARDSTAPAPGVASTDAAQPEARADVPAHTAPGAPGNQAARTTDEAQMGGQARDQAGVPGDAGSSDSNRDGRDTRDRRDGPRDAQRNAARPLRQANADQAGPARTTAPTSANVPPASELPDDIRRELPQLVVGGAMYSESAATRMLVINSQVLHEGDQAAPGVVLQEIRLKSAVLSYRGYRYSITY